ncbi:MAG: ABC transporter ATP-binding protein [Bifidobacteriaceae bacterium]|jgi:ABC-2 type transport system ATP-binding protein|nr:ABC transporter ATP-binding protein [Bifidobacteriaceae bacterium]
MTLKTTHLTKKYKRKAALDDVSLEFQPDTIYALLGNNGAGKSTLLNIISNRIFASTGSVTLDGEKAQDDSTVLRHMYLMSEDNMFPGSMKVKEIFTLSDAVYGDFDWELADKLVADFELPVDSQFKKLSTGYRTIAKLVAAMCVPVDYVFLDEPVLGLDANHRDLFYTRLMETFVERPRTIVISTHLIEEIATLVENVVIIDHGRIITVNDADTLAHAGHAASGETTAVNAFVTTSGLDVLATKTITGHTTAYVQGTIPDAAGIPAGISIEPLGLQDYFIHLTQRQTTQHHSNALLATSLKENAR